MRASHRHDRASRRHFQRRWRFNKPQDVHGEPKCFSTTWPNITLRLIVVGSILRKTYERVRGFIDYALSPAPYLSWLPFIGPEACKKRSENSRTSWQVPRCWCSQTSKNLSSWRQTHLLLPWDPFWGKSRTMEGYILSISKAVQWTEQKIITRCAKENHL